MNLDFFNIFITVSLSVGGWIISYLLTSKRDLKTKRRDLITEHLIEAYRVLNTEVAHRPDSEEKYRKLENIFSDIQLFGSINQIKITQDLIKEFASTKNIEIDDLINDLRNDLRKHLQLKSVKGNGIHLRWSSKKGNVII